MVVEKKDRVELPENTVKSGLMSKKIRVGLDFDGVVAYNPFRVVRAPVAMVKKKIFREKKLKFLIPANKWQRMIWSVVFGSSMLPAQGVELLREMATDPRWEFHLVTARFSFLQDDLAKWLNKNGLTDVFKTINLNKKDDQPHLFKEEIMKRLNVHYFVDDNLDIVEYLAKKKNAKIYWIYNFIDRSYPYEFKYPYLEKALRGIATNEDTF